MSHSSRGSLAAFWFRHRSGFGVALGALVCQMGLAYGYTLSALAGEIQSDLAWTRTMYAGALGPQILVIALMSPLVGAATIRYGPRRVLVSAGLLLGMSFSLLSGIDALWQLYALIVLLGLSFAGLGDIAVSQAVSQWFRRGRGLALGVVFTGSNLGGYLLIWASGAITEVSSWRTAFLIMAMGAFAIIVPAAFWLVRDPATTTSETIPEAEPDEDTTTLDARAALRTRSFWILAFALFVFFFYLMAITQHLVLFLTDHEMEASLAREWFATAVGLGLISKVLLGLLASFLPARTTLWLDYGLIAASSIALLYLPDARWLPFFIVLYGFSTAARDVVYPLIVTYCFGLRYMAQIYGLLMIALLPGGVLGPLFAAWIFDNSGSYTAAFQVFSILNLLALIALAWVRNERGRNHRDEEPGSTEDRSATGFSSATG